jgi:glycosyltransferase involved in cell wall biosynthesis
MQVTLLARGMAHRLIAAARALRQFARSARHELATSLRNPAHLRRRLAELPGRVRAFLATRPARIETWLYRFNLAQITQTVVLRLHGRWFRPDVPRSVWAGAPILYMAFTARAERLLGVKAESVVLQTYFITKEFDYVFERWAKVPVVRVLLPYLVFAWACLRYQRFHYYCDYGFLPIPQKHHFNPTELETLRRLGKEVYFWTYGPDVRTKKRTEELGPYNCCMECPHVGFACICDDQAGEAYIPFLQRYGTIFAMGDMIEYTPGSRNDLFFWPVDIDAEGGNKYAPRYPDPNASGPVRVLHAPNHRHYKGTRHLLQAVENLQREGQPIELKLVERVPNREALAIYRTADIVFDQCIIGFHGYFALEAMAMGKPVMCYIRDPERYLLHPEECPMINARADKVESVLRALLHDRQRLHELGQRGRRYIEKHFTPRAFAERMRRAYIDLGVAPDLQRRAVNPRKTLARLPRQAA